VFGQVVDDVPDLGVGQGGAADLGPQGRRAGRRRRRGDMDRGSRRHAQAPEGGLGQAGLQRAHQGGIVADHHGGQEGASAGPDLDLAHARQPLGPQGSA